MLAQVIALARRRSSPPCPLCGAPLRDHPPGGPCPSCEHCGTGYGQHRRKGRRLLCPRPGGGGGPALQVALAVLVSACAIGAAVVAPVPGHRAEPRHLHHAPVAAIVTLDAYRSAPLTRYVTWRTCVPGTARLTGPYRVYDDAWASPLCISESVAAGALSSANLRVTSAARPQGAGVVAYPDIQYGSAYGYTTPGSGMPLPVSRLRHMNGFRLHIVTRGRPGGHWIADLDGWFYPSSSVTCGAPRSCVVNGHGAAELVVILRGDAGFDPRGGRLVEIGQRSWYVREWMTCVRGPSGACAGPSWPLLRFAAARPVWRVRSLPLASFVNLAARRGLLGGVKYMGDFAVGFELWSGGRGLYVRLGVTR